MNNVSCWSCRRLFFFKSKQDKNGVQLKRLGATILALSMQSFRIELTNEAILITSLLSEDWSRAFSSLHTEGCIRLWEKANKWLTAVSKTTKADSPPCSCTGIAGSLDECMLQLYIL